MTLIDLSLCTFRRPGVAGTLRSINELDIPAGVRLRVLVVDNDHAPSARDTVAGAARGMDVAVHYIHAPAANISVARNAGLDAAKADWIAFLDDDETVPSGWLRALLDRQAKTDADAVFGHSQARYGPEAPDWIVAHAYHSNVAKARGGIVFTGHTCNALLRWGDAPWTHARFDLGRGRSGGEDTEFFFRLFRMGARYAIADDAPAYEDVAPERLSLRWLRKRHYRMGQSYASSAPGARRRLALFATASAKAAFCHAMAVATAPAVKQRNFWILRGTMHAGVCAGCLSLPSEELYGHA